MKKPASSKSVLTPAEEIRFLAVRTKAAQDHALTTKRIARLSKQKLKSARRTFKHSRKVAKRARKAAARLRKTLASATKKMARGEAKVGKPKKSAQAPKPPLTAKKAIVQIKRRAVKPVGLRKKKSPPAGRVGVSRVQKKRRAKPVVRKPSQVEIVALAPAKVSRKESSTAPPASEFAPLASRGKGAADS